MSAKAKAVWGLLVWAALVATAAAGGPGWEEALVGANAAYRQGDYAAAAEAYGRVLAGGHVNGHLEYNLGNSWFHLDRPGRALLHYERARLWIPRDPDLAFNLRQVREQVPEAVAPDADLAHTLLFWVGSFNLTELFRVLAVLNVLFWGLLALRHLRPADWQTYLLVLCGITGGLAGASWGLKLHDIRADRRVVVVAREAPVRAGPDGGDTVLFSLAEGSVATAERTEEGWVLIGLDEQRRGWISREAVAGVRLGVAGGG